VSVPADGMAFMILLSVLFDDKIVYKNSATVMSHACNGSSLDYTATVISLKSQQCMKFLIQSRLVTHILLIHKTVVTFCKLLEKVSHHWLGLQQ